MIPWCSQVAWYIQYCIKQYHPATERTLRVMFPLLDQMSKWVIMWSNPFLSRRESQPYPKRCLEVFWVFCQLSSGGRKLFSEFFYKFLCIIHCSSCGKIGYRQNIQDTVYFRTAVRGSPMGKESPSGLVRRTCLLLLWFRWRHLQKNSETMMK